MRTSESVQVISEAIVDFQSEMEAVKKGASNPFFKSKYADLPSIIEAIKPVAANQGIAILQEIINEADGILICNSRIIHTSGEWIEGECPVHYEKATPQGYGSAVTYARRYGLQSILGLSAADDDGNQAEKDAAKKKPKKGTRTPVKPAPAEKPETPKVSKDTLAQVSFIKKVALEVGMGAEEIALTALKDWSKYEGKNDGKTYMIKSISDLDAADPRWITMIYKRAVEAGKAIDIEDDNEAF